MVKNDYFCPQCLKEFNGVSIVCEKNRVVCAKCNVVTQKQEKKNVNMSNKREQ